MRRHRMRLSVVLVAIAGFVLAACGSSASGGSGSTSSTPGSAASQPATTAHLTVGILPIADAGGYFVAEAQGFFKQHHVTVTAKNITGGATLIPALESGAMNIGFSNLVSVLESGEHNFGMKCIAGTLQKPATGHDLSLVVSPKDASITSAKDLNGKTVAVNTLGNVLQLIVDDWMTQNGGNPSTVHFVAVPFPDMPGELAKGSIAAAMTDEPFTTLSLKSGAKVLNPHPYQVVAKTPVFSCWLVDGKWLASHESAARAFVAALNESDAYLAAHPGYLRTILPKYTSISAALAQQIALPHITTELSPADLKAWQTAALKFGFLKSPVNINSLIANLGS